MRWFLRSGLRWAFLALVIVAFLWFVPQLQGEYFSPKVSDKERPALVNEYRRTWAQIIGGFGLLLGLYFTWRRVEISLNQQVTDRFTRAIDQLGATDDTTSKPRLEVRLGSIYVLERIARDSPARDYNTVMKVLTAYVRENARLRPKSSKCSATEQDQGAEQGEESTSGTPRTDIQAALAVLGRREEDGVPAEPRLRLDLQGTYLRRALLPEAHFKEALLQGTDLHGANLLGADFRDVNLQDANLQDANLQDAYLGGAKVTDEQLANTQSLQGATMPDGRRYEDWRKDKEGSEKDVENE